MDKSVDHFVKLPFSDILSQEFLVLLIFDYKSKALGSFLCPMSHPHQAQVGTVEIN